MVITGALMEAAKTVSGGYTRKQLEAIGIEWPPPKGWRKAILGRSITEEELKGFLCGKEFHIPVEEDIPRNKVSIYVKEFCDSLDTKIGHYYILLSTVGKELMVQSSLFEHTTNYRMIIQGSIDAIKKLKCPCEIDLYTTTVFGLSRIRCCDGTWLESPKGEINSDLLMELRNVVLEGNHLINPIVDKLAIVSKIVNYKHL